jgi:hypothetical protein
MGLFGKQGKCKIFFGHHVLSRHSIAVVYLTEKGQGKLSDTLKLSSAIGDLEKI